MREVVLDGFGIEGLGFPLNHGNGTLRTFTETGRETVAVTFRDEPCLTIDKFDSSFRAGLNAFAATVAFLSIDTDYFSFHFHD